MSSGEYVECTGGHTPTLYDSLWWGLCSPHCTMLRLSGALPHASKAA